VLISHRQLNGSNNVRLDNADEMCLHPCPSVNFLTVFVVKPLYKARLPNPELSMVKSFLTEVKARLVMVIRSLMMGVSSWFSI